MDVEEREARVERSTDDFAAIPEELRQRPQWVNWKIGEIKFNGKFKKLPIDPVTAFKMDADHPDNWQTFAETVAYYCAGVGDGIGYVFSEDDPYTGIDLDGSRNPESGDISETAEKIIRAVPTYWEISASETGVKGICEAILPAGYASSGNLSDGAGIEVYDRRRMFALTGAVLDGYEQIVEAQDAVDDLCETYLRKKTLEVVKRDAVRPDAVAPAFDSSLIAELTDDEIIGEICAAENGAEFDHLWNGGNGADVSAGDLLVAQRLSSFTHGDAERIKRMMAGSPRCRPKYSEKHGRRGETFLDLAVDRAVRGTNWLWTAPMALQNLATVRRTIRVALDKASTDKQALYKSDVLGALAWLKDNRPGEWDSIKDNLRAAKISLQDLKTAMKSCDSRIHRTTSQELITVQAALPGTPSPALVIPRGYTITETSTALLTVNQMGQKQIEPFAHAPVYITERMVNNDDSLQYLRLGWYQDGRHHSLIVDRGVAMSQSKLQTLASNGLPVTSFNSSVLCKYLSDFEAANRATLPVVRISSQLGWQGRYGRDGFLLGRCLILPNGEILETGGTTEEETAPKAQGHIQFHPNSAGERQIADAIHSKGTLAGWLKSIELLRDFPKAKLGIYIGLVPPLLEILNAPNFVIDFAGVTTAGKTTTLKVAASNWGDPDSRSDLAYLQGWHVTKVFIERAISVLNFLPLILDDTKTVRFKEMVGEVIYQVVFGKGKGRGTIDGLGVTRAQKTVLISSGEGPAREFTNDGGSRMRCLEIMDSPFGQVTKENGRLVTKLESGLLQDYGHAGPAFIQWLSRNRDRWPELKARYDQRTADYTDAATNPQAGRLAKYAAAIDMAAYILHQAVEMPWPYEDPLKDLWAEMSAGAAEAPPEIRALQAIEGWCYSNETTFYGRHEVVGSTLKPKVPVAG